MTRPVLSRVATPLLVSLACAALSLALFAWLAEEMLEGDIRQFDSVVRQFVHAHSSNRLTAAMRLFSFLGSALFVTVAAALCCAALWIRGRRRGALAIAITVVGGSLLMWVLKISFQRQRPEPFFDTRLPASYSFPSGHALLSFCLCGAGAAVFSSDREKRWVRIVIWIFAAVLTLTIGYSRIYLGVHYPSDVLAGYLGALVWVLGIGIAYREAVRSRFRTGMTRGAAPASG